ncbi:hypothetical protein FHS29_001377 [Saccharothrix tamanrassetensis]|uniref:Uncharacterized protein n=1 Tax=Saccharothrix tamanrassetensis TaxID=1051531 RepID=A0A841CF73_9PSEU|nr:hypothetical protein [Saccharothrix tamanrassetensis]MBB5954807.1 hypothetical protein [Saccharothrix tamanrassetensis]
MRSQRRSKWAAGLRVIVVDPGDRPAVAWWALLPPSGGLGDGCAPAARWASGPARLNCSGSGIRRVGGRIRVILTGDRVRLAGPAETLREGGLIV